MSSNYNDLIEVERGVYIDRQSITSIVSREPSAGIYEVLITWTAARTGANNANGEPTLSYEHIIRYNSKELADSTAHLLLQAKRGHVYGLSAPPQPELY